MSDVYDKDTLIQQLSICACLHYELTTYTVWVVLWNLGHITITYTFCEIWNTVHRLVSCVESIYGTEWIALASGLNKAIDFLTKSVHNRRTSTGHCRPDDRSLFSAAISWLRDAEAITKVISYSDRKPGMVGQSGEVKRQMRAIIILQPLLKVMRSHCAIIYFHE